MSDLEDAMRRQIAADEAAEKNRQEKVAQRLADSAKHAADFISLMRKHHIDPEPIYTREQVQRGRRRSRVTIEKFELVDRGWVVSYGIDKFNLPWLIRYLRPDGQVVECSASRIGSMGRTEGLVMSSRDTSFSELSGSWVLYLNKINGEHSLHPTKPAFPQDVFVAAARRYTNLGLCNPRTSQVRGFLTLGI